MNSLFAHIFNRTNRKNKTHKGKCLLKTKLKSIQIEDLFISQKPESMMHDTINYSLDSFVDNTVYTYYLYNRSLEKYSNSRNLSHMKFTKNGF